MITNEDIENLNEEISQEEIAQISKKVQTATKKAIFEILDQYTKDSRNVTTQAMTYAASTVIEVGITGLLMMCNGQRKAVDNLLKELVDHIVKNVDFDDDGEEK